MKLFVALYIVLNMLLGAPLNTLVDESNPLPRWFDPGPNPEAIAALDALMAAATEAGHEVHVYSAYRNYGQQIQTLEREWNVKPQTAIYTVAEAGESEHQLGTAFDLVWPGLMVEHRDPRNERLYTWLEENAHHYGFIVSYPYKEIEEWPYNNRWMPQVTVFIYEPWHIRYVGVALAEEMVRSGYLDPQSSVLPQDFYQPWAPAYP